MTDVDGMTQNRKWVKLNRVTFKTMFYKIIITVMKHCNKRSALSGAPGVVSYMAQKMSTHCPAYGTGVQN